MLPSLRARRVGIFPSLLEEWPFDEFLRHTNGGSRNESAQGIFAADVVELKDRYEIAMDVPGLAQKDIELSMEDNTLSIKLERQKPESAEGASCLHCGRWFGSTIRTLTLPEGVSNDEVEAILKDGVLTVTVKKQPEKQARKIEIKELN